METFTLVLGYGVVGELALGVLGGHVLQEVA
jgi:hypothetical protein